MELESGHRSELMLVARSLHRTHAFVEKPASVGHARTHSTPTSCISARRDGRR